MNQTLCELHDQIRLRSVDLGKLLLATQKKLVTAESCTGGWIAKAVTDVAGSSKWFESGFVTYSNASKDSLLGVCEATLENHGAVSDAVVNEMVAGAMFASGSDIGVSVSGIAGPDGGSPEKPVGTVWFAWALKDEVPRTECFLFPGDRDEVRAQAVITALEGLIALLKAA